MAAHIFFRLPNSFWEAVGIRGSRAFKFLGIDPRDFVHYEVATPFHTKEQLWQAIWHDRMPFKTHAQFCGQVLGKGDCDCGADWMKFSASGRTEPFTL